MRTIKDFQGQDCNLSEEVYEAIEPISLGRYPAGTRVRLISGVNGSIIPGYHFNDAYVTVCPVSATGARFIGVRKDNLRKVN